MCSTLSNDPDVPWHEAIASSYEASVLGNLKTSDFFLHYYTKNFSILWDTSRYLLEGGSPTLHY